MCITWVGTFEEHRKKAKKVEWNLALCGDAEDPSTIQLKEQQAKKVSRKTGGRWCRGLNGK